jgi:ABC-2 type transport system permease protein
VLAFIARHEWRLLIRSAVVRLVLVVLAGALVTAAALGSVRAAREQRTHDAFAARASQQRAQARSLAADAIANERGWLALLPPAPLSALAAGQSDVYPGYLKVTARHLDALVSGDQIDHPLGVASGHLDAAFVILFLYPLLIFAVSFDLTATERDRGTLRMVLAQPIALADVVAGKMLARWLLLTVPVVALPPLFVLDRDPARLATWTAAVMAYGLIWHGLALIVNARGWNAATNALVLAGTWLMFAIVGPASINLLIDVRYPMPSRVEAAVQARAATQDATVQGSRQLGQFLQDHPTSANVGRDGLRQFAQLQAARDRQVAERMQAVESAFAAQLQRQQRLASWLSVLSPTMVAQGVLLDVAGTGASRFSSFEAAAKDFQAEWQAYFEPRVLDAATLSVEEAAAAPSFSFREEPASAAAARVAPTIVVLASAGGALLLLGVRAYRGYPL